MVELKPEVARQAIDMINGMRNMPSVVVDHGSGFDHKFNGDDMTNTCAFSTAVSTTADLEGVVEITLDTSKLKADAKEAFFDEDFKKSVCIFTQAIGNGPATSELYSDRAKVHIKMKNYTEAVSDCNRALELDSSCLKGYLRKGIALMKQNKYQSAREALELCAFLSSDVPRCTDLIKECDERIAAKFAAAKEFGDGSEQKHNKPLDVAKTHGSSESLSQVSSQRSVEHIDAKFAAAKESGDGSEQKHSQPIDVAKTHCLSERPFQVSSQRSVEHIDVGMSAEKMSKRIDGSMQNYNQNLAIAKSPVSAERLPQAKFRRSARRKGTWSTHMPPLAKDRNELICTTMGGGSLLLALLPNRARFSAFSYSHHFPLRFFEPSGLCSLY